MHSLRSTAGSTNHKTRVPSACTVAMAAAFTPVRRFRFCPSCQARLHGERLQATEHVDHTALYPGPLEPYAFALAHITFADATSRLTKPSMAAPSIQRATATRSCSGSTKITLEPVPR